MLTPPQVRQNVAASEEAKPCAASMRSWSLQRLLDPISKANFFDRYYESKPLFIRRGRPDYFDGLLTLADIDRVITTLDTHYGDISLVDADRKIEIAEFTNRDDTIDVARLFQLHAEGATIIVNHLHRRHPPLAELCAALELDFSAAFQTNIYLTPPRAKGFKAHFDTHDVFVIQLGGSKHWRLYGTPIQLPLQGQDENATYDDPGAPTEEIHLAEGDTLYIPRGLVHDAVSRDDISLHITVGALPYTWSTLMLETVANAILNEPSFRKALPREFARATFDREVISLTLRNFLARVPESADFDAVVQRFVDDFVDRRRQRLRGQLSQVTELDSITLDSSVCSRPHLAYSLHEDATTIRIRCYGKEISIPSFASTAVRYALETPRYAVRDLPDYLDDEGKLVLVRRLVAEGILMVNEARDQ